MITFSCLHNWLFVIWTSVKIEFIYYIIISKNSKYWIFTRFIFLRSIIFDVFGLPLRLSIFLVIHSVSSKIIGFYPWWHLPNFHLHKGLQCYNTNYPCRPLHVTQVYFLIWMNVNSSNNTNLHNFLRRSHLIMHIFLLQDYAIFYYQKIFVNHLIFLIWISYLEI